MVGLAINRPGRCPVNRKTEVPKIDRRDGKMMIQMNGRVWDREYFKFVEFGVKGVLVNRMVGLNPKGQARYMIITVVNVELISHM